MLIQNPPTQKNYEDLLASEVGFLFKLADDYQYEDFVEDVKRNTPQDKLFEVAYIPVGHYLYAGKGANTIIIVKNEPIS